MTEPENLSNPNPAILVVVNGPSSGLTTKIPVVGELVVGRGKETDLQIIDFRLSREHFSVSRDQNHWVVRDLGSTNGTHIADQPISKVKIDDDATIVAGDTTFKIQVVNDQSSIDLLQAQLPQLDDIAARRTWRRG